MKRLLCALVVAVTVASVAGIMAQTPDPGRGGVWVTGAGGGGGEGDITSVVAGSGMTGGGTEGTVTLNVIGTADAITVSADAVTIASTYVGQTSITTLGTVATGTWQATDVGVAYGGTGASTLTDGYILLGSGTGAITPLNVTADGAMLVGDGTGDPVAESGATLRTSIGVGTGDSPTFTAVTAGQADITAEGDLRLQDNTGGEYVGFDAPATVSGSYTLTLPAAIGSVNQVLSISNVDGTLQWGAPESGDITSVVAGAGMTGGGTTGDVTLNVIGTADVITVSADAVTIASGYVGQTSITTLGTIATGTWQSTDVGVAYGGTGVSTLTANSLLLGAGTSAVTFAAPGTSGNVLTSNGTVWASSAPGVVTSLDTGTVAYAGRTITVDTGGVLNVVLASSAGDDFTVDTDKLVVSGDSGNVGIGTTAPAAGLSVEGGAIFNDSHAAVGFRVETDTNANMLAIESNSYSGVGTFGIGANGAEASLNAWIGIIGPATTAGAGDSFHRMRINSTAGGAVTIPAGTAGMVVALRVDEPNITATGTVTEAVTLYVSGAPTEGTSNYALYVGSGATYLGGNVGIGTAAPAAILHIADTSEPLGGAYSTAGNVFISSTDAFDAANVGGSLSLGGEVNAGETLATFARIHGRKTNTSTGDTSGYLAFETNLNTGGNLLHEHMRITHAGNVGIGTTSPATLLDVSKNQNADTAVTIRNVGVGTAAQATLKFGNVNGDAVGRIGSLGSGFTTANALQQDGFYVQSQRQDLILSAENNGDIRFWNGAAETMVVEYGGNVGIGTAAPDSKLHVVGTVNVRSSSLQTFHDSANALNLKMNDGGVTFNEDSADKDFRIESDGDAFAFFLEGSSGNVGIGPADPKSALHVSDGSLNGNIHAGGNTTVLGSLFNHQTVASGYMNISMLNNTGGANARINLGFGVIASDVPTNTVMTLNQLGDVGIGVTPTVRLHVKNTASNDVVTIEGGTAGVISRIQHANHIWRAPWLRANGDLRYFNQTDDRYTLTLTAAGFVGINTNTPISLLDVRGPTGTGAAPAGLLTLATDELTIVDGDQLGRVNFSAPLESSGTDAILTGAAIWAEADATFTASVNSTELVFATGTTAAATEVFRLGRTASSSVVAHRLIAGNEAGLHLDAADFTLVIGRTRPDQDDDPQINFYSSGRCFTPAGTSTPICGRGGSDSDLDYPAAGLNWYARHGGCSEPTCPKWDSSLVAPGHTFSGVGNGHLRLKGSTFAIRGPGTNFANTTGARGNGHRYILFQSCSVAECEDDIDRSSYIVHLEGVGSQQGLGFGTDDDKMDPGTENLIACRMVMRTNGLFPVTHTTCEPANGISFDLGGTTGRFRDLFTVDQDTTNAETVTSSLLTKVPESIIHYGGSALDVVRKIDVVTFRHLNEYDPSGRMKLGVIAESISEPLATPWKTYDGFDGPGVDTLALTALNTKSIQELALLVEAQQEEIERLQELIEDVR